MTHNRIKFGSRLRGDTAFFEIDTAEVLISGFVGKLASRSYPEAIASHWGNTLLIMCTSGY
jgi:hypothetical protein